MNVFVFLMVNFIYVFYNVIFKILLKIYEFLFMFLKNNFIMDKYYIVYI